MNDLLLDTCAVIWVAQGAKLAPDARAAIAGRNLHVSPITAWEIANLARKKRIALALPVTDWIRQTLEKLEAKTPQLTIDLLVDSCQLPGTPPDDPADRIIIATARDGGLDIVTRDSAILAYAQAGYVGAKAC